MKAIDFFEWIRLTEASKQPSEAECRKLARSFLAAGNERASRLWHHRRDDDARDEENRRKMGRPSLIPDDMHGYNWPDR